MKGQMRFLLLESLVWGSHRRGNGLEWDGKGKEDPVEVEWEEDKSNWMDLRFHKPIFCLNALALSNINSMFATLLTSTNRYSG